MRISVVCLFLLSVAWAQGATTAPATRESAFRIDCRKVTDTIVVSTDAGATVLTVSSRTGIGSATVERLGEQWPQRLVLRLRLQGLESFSLANSEIRLNASVASHSGNTVSLRMARGNGEGEAVGKESEYWMDIRVVNAEGKAVKGLPGAGGWFEMTVPAAMLGEKSNVLRLNWIDFYR